MMPIQFPEDKTPMALASRYLMERGIQAETIELCGLEASSKQNCLDMIGSSRKTNYKAGLIIPYDGEYCTVRWLGDNVSAFGTKLKDDPKLLAPKGPPRVYTPPLPSCSGENFSGTVYLCESALKAIVMAQAGYYAIAGNGVDGIFTNEGFSVGFPSSLFDSGVERAVILFDSDWSSNANVSAAIRRQATGIANTYPNVQVVHKGLSVDADGNHWGIDDATAKNGEAWLHEWLASSSNEHDVEISPLQQHLDELNDGYVICMHPLSVIRQKTGITYSKSQFTDVLEASRTYKERLDKRMIKISPAHEWVEWEDHNLVEKLVYSPGAPRLGDSYYNSWRDDGVCAADGDVEPFLRVYKNAIPDAEVRELLIESMAWILQNRGTKLDKTFLLVGSQVGTGKSMFAQTMGKIVGRSNYSSIGVEDFTSDFNSSFVSKEVVLLDDLYKLNKASMGKLKRYITDETIMVNPKGVAQYEVDNHAVYFITSNEFVSLPMDNNERRVLTVEFAPTVHYPTGSAWWKEYVEWLNSGGYEAIRSWLENLDLGGCTDDVGNVIDPPYDPTFMPPMTDTKSHIIQSTQSPEEAWCADLHSNVDEILHMTKRSVFTPDELWVLYTGGGDKPNRTESIAFGQALGKWFRRANGGKVIKVGGKVARYWVVRDCDAEWANRQVIKDVKDYSTFTVG